MTFRFIGKNGSLGFVQGAYYDLGIIVKKDDNWIWIVYKGFQIPYSSFKSFFKNWEELG